MKVLFVDHRYHAKTGSSLFLVDLLKKQFDVTVLYEDSLPPGKPLTSVSLGVDSFDAVMVFQIGIGDLGRRIRHRNLTFVPMYDSIDLDDIDMWRRLEGVKIISLCNALQRKAAAHNGNSLYVQYYPENKSTGIPKKTGSGVFFWPRNRGVGWKDVKQLLGNYQSGFVHLHKAMDPGQRVEYPTEIENRAYNISYSSWFPKHSDYLGLLSRFTFYVAPRLREGIGVSFLEAMSQGCVVIAADRPTMNEYIQDGKNGFLYDPERPSMLDFSNVLRLSQNAMDSSADGRERWRESEKELIDFVMTPRSSLAKKGARISIAKKQSLFNRAFVKKLRSFRWLKHALPYGVVMGLKRKKDEASRRINVD